MFAGGIGASADSGEVFLRAGLVGVLRGLLAVSCDSPFDGGAWDANEFAHERSKAVVLGPRGGLGFRL